MKKAIIMMIVVFALVVWPFSGVWQLLSGIIGGGGNYALAAGLKVADALAIEDASGDAAQTYAKSDCSDEILERLEGRQSAELLKLYSL